MSEYTNAQHWLESLLPKAELSDSEQDAVRALVGNPGFGYLLQLIGSERQGDYVLLSNLNLEDASQRRLASVTQGKIGGVERLREVVLSLFPQEVPHREGDPQ
jgi:hypothetical protein